MGALVGGALVISLMDKADGDPTNEVDDSNDVTEVT